MTTKRQQEEAFAMLLLIAANVPVTLTRPETRLSSHLVDDLRAFLDEVGYDWRGFRDNLIRQGSPWVTTTNRDRKRLGLPDS